MTGGMRGALYWVRAMCSTHARSKLFFVHLEQYRKSKSCSSATAWAGTSASPRISKPLLSWVETCKGSPPSTPLKRRSNGSLNFPIEVLTRIFNASETKHFPLQVFTIEENSIKATSPSFKIPTSISLGSNEVRLLASSSHVSTIGRRARESRVARQCVPTT